MACEESVVIDGVKYVREKPAVGKRAVVVIDRGWVMAGDLEDREGRIYLSRVVWVFRWESIGFAGVIANPQAPGVHLRPMADLNIPAGAEIFRVPVADHWGL